MSRYIKILDGCDCNDIAEAEAGSESGQSYNYYLFLRPGGSGGILRENLNGLELRLFVFGSFTESTWNDRQTQVYQRTSEFKSL